MICPMKFNSKTLFIPSGRVKQGNCQCEGKECAWWITLNREHQNSEGCALTEYITTAFMIKER